MHVIQKEISVERAVVFLQKATAAPSPIFFPGRACHFSLGYSGAYLSGTSPSFSEGGVGPTYLLKRKLI